MFGIGTTELIVVAIVALLLFGNRLPSVMRSLGQGVNEFKRGLNDVQQEMDRPKIESSTVESPADHVTVEKATIEEPAKP